MNVKHALRFIDSHLGNPIIKSRFYIRRAQTIRKMTRVKNSAEISFLVTYPRIMDDELTRIFRRNGSDKATLEEDYPSVDGHFYSYFYSILFSGLRNHQINLLEFGIGQGGSLLSWNEYFPNANIVGLDNRPDSFIQKERIESYQADMYSKISLSKFFDSVADKRFSIILDDGPHDFESTKNAFETCFSLFADQFIYVCEDIPSRDFESYDSFFRAQSLIHELNLHYVFFNQKNWDRTLHGSNDYNTLAILKR
jgi:hypothetical protein